MVTVSGGKKISLLGHAHVVEEAIISGGTVLQEATVVPLTGLSENVGAGVPEDSLSLGVIHIQELEATISLEDTVEIPLLRIHLNLRGTVH